MSKGKGSAFERQVCKHLSLWWTGGENDAVFWRTSNSGGRATVRGKSGKKTNGQAGDICATDPIGKPLLDVVTFELKRGYNFATLHALLDAPVTAAKQTYEEWIDQAEQSRHASGSLYWAIIHQRDRRKATITVPDWLWNDLGIHLPGVFVHRESGEDLRCCLLSEFLEAVSPADIEILSKR